MGSAFLADVLMEGEDFFVCFGLSHTASLFSKAVGWSDGGLRWMWRCGRNRL